MTRIGPEHSPKLGLLQLDAHLPATGLVAAFRFRGECRLDGDRMQKHGLAPAS